MVSRDMAMRIQMYHLRSEVIKHNATCELCTHDMYSETYGMYLEVSLLLMMQFLARIPFDPSLIVDPVQQRVQVETRRRRKACCETVRLTWRNVPKLQTRTMVPDVRSSKDVPKFHGVYQVP